MRALLREELGLADRQLPHVALGSRMFTIEPTSIKGRVARRIARQRLILGGIVAGRRLLPLFIPGSNGAPAQEQGAGLQNFLLGQVKLGRKVCNRNATMAIDRRKNAVGTRDISRVHAADGRITTQQQRGHAKLGADASRCAMNVKTARKAQEKLRHAYAACARCQKVTALVQEHEDRKHQKAPKDR